MAESLKVKGIDYQKLGEVTLGEILIEMFGGSCGKCDEYEDADFLRRFLHCLHEDLEAIADQVECTDIPDNFDTILRRHANRCRLAIQIQDRMDAAHAPASKPKRSGKGSHLRVAETTPEPEGSAS
jgi:hypothetical protein